MADAAGQTVHIGYPLRAEPDDETWLDAAAARHRGQLGDLVLESHPAQRSAFFETNADAQAFVVELAASSRWQAGTADRSFEWPPLA